MLQFDERDTMFSRIGLIKGTRKYKSYYNRKPYYLIDDDDLRQNTLKMMARIYAVEEFKFPIAQKIVSLIVMGKNILSLLKFIKPTMDASDRPIVFGKFPDDDMASDQFTVSAPALKAAKAVNEAARRKKIPKHKANIEPHKLTKIIKKLANAYGADAVGIAKLNKQQHYSHRGDLFGMGVGYGKRINISYKYAVVVAAELDDRMIKCAPNPDVWVATMLGYARSASVTAQLALYIKSLGYEAETDNFFEYKSPLTPLAAAAGIGQIGRCNLVVNKVYGTRIKVAAVLTNVPLIEDGPIDFGLIEYCNTCYICAKACPAEAISYNKPELINGFLQWEHQSVKCMKAWMKTETGCGICMSICPFSNNESLLRHEKHYEAQLTA